MELIKSIGDDTWQMTPLWNALDRKFQVLYVYTMHCKAGATRGAYLHKKRTGRIYLLSGNVEIKYRRSGETQYQMCWMSEMPGNLPMMELPAMTEYAITAIDDSVLINLCDYPWSEYESEMEKL